MTEATRAELEEAARLGLIDYSFCQDQSLPVCDAASALAWVWDMANRRVPLSAAFDPAAYMDMYPDIEPEPIHPIIHYLRHGMGEGRASFAVFDVALHGMKANSRPIWIEAHDLSLTGAPMALHHMLQGWPELAQSTVLGAPACGPMQARFEALGCRFVPHGLGARRVREAPKADALVEKCRIALLHSKVGGVLGNSVLAWPMILAARNLGLPTAWIIHEPDAKEVSALFDAALFERICGAIAQVDRLIFVSGQSRAAWGAQDRPGAQVIEKALPPHRPGHRDTGRMAAGCKAEDILVLSVGSVSARKGQADLIAAFEMLTESPAFARLVAVVIGYAPSPYAEDLRQRLAGLRKKGLRAFMLPESRNDKDRRVVEHLFAAADIFAMTSRAESLPLTTAEALAEGCPVISTDVPGIADLIAEGETGLLYRPGDIAQLARHIEHLAQDNAARAKMRAAVLARPATIGFARMIDAYKAALADVLPIPALVGVSDARGPSSAR